MLDSTLKHILSEEGTNKNMQYLLYLSNALGADECSIHNFRDRIREADTAGSKPQAQREVLRVYNALYTGYENELRSGTLSRYRHMPQWHAMFYCHYLWARSGFQTVRVGHRLAAALMVSYLPDEIPELPLRAFRIIVPDGLIPAREGYVRSFTIGVAADNEVAFRLAYGTKGDVFISAMCRLDDLLIEDANRSKLSSEDERALLMCKRLAVGISLAMGEAESNPSSGISVQRTNKRASGSTPQTTRIDIQCESKEHLGDFREEVRNFVKGVNKLHKHQWLVKGHWFNQAYGPQHSLRRTAWRKPHWKGVEDAPILVRTRTV